MHILYRTMFVATLALVAACARPVALQRRCRNANALDETVITLVDYNNERVPGAKMLLLQTDLAREWYVDTDQAGSVRLNLPPGLYRIWGMLGQLKEEGRFEVTAGCATTVVLRLKFYELAPDAELFTIEEFRIRDAFQLVPSFPRGTNEFARLDVGHLRPHQLRLRVGVRDRERRAVLSAGDACI